MHPEVRLGPPSSPLTPNSSKSLDICPPATTIPARGSSKWSPRTTFSSAGVFRRTSALMGRPIPSKVSPKAPKPTARERGPWARLKDLLSSPIDGASLAAFRIAVGLVMALEAYELCRPNVAAISAGTTPLQTYYTGADISFHLPYPLFSWLPLLPAPWIYAIVG